LSNYFDQLFFVAAGAYSLWVARYRHDEYLLISEL